MVLLETLNIALAVLEALASKPRKSPEQVVYFVAAADSMFGRQSIAVHATAFVVVQGYVRFVCDILIPGVIQSFCKDNFNIKDANQWRSVSEFAGLLEILQKRFVDVYYQEVLVGKFANHLGCPAPLVEGFRTASNRKDMESSLKNLIEQSHQHEWRSMP
jgi:hypothetical protein